MALPTIAEIKANLILSGTQDDALLTSMLASAIAYAEIRQHRRLGSYSDSPSTMSANTKQAIIMLVTHWFESRDGGTGGFFADSPAAASSAVSAINMMLDLEREWKV